MSEDPGHGSSTGGSPYLPPPPPSGRSGPEPFGPMPPAGRATTGLSTRRKVLIGFLASMFVIGLIGQFAGDSDEGATAVSGTTGALPLSTESPTAAPTAPAARQSAKAVKPGPEPVKVPQLANSDTVKLCDYVQDTQDQVTGGIGGAVASANISGGDPGSKLDLLRAYRDVYKIQVGGAPNAKPALRSDVRQSIVVLQDIIDLLASGGGEFESPSRIDGLPAVWIAANDDIDAHC